MDSKEKRKVAWEIAQRYGLVTFDDDVKEAYAAAKTQEEKDALINGIKDDLISGRKKTDLAAMGLPED